MNKIIFLLVLFFAFNTNSFAGDLTGNVSAIRFFTTSWTSYNDTDIGLAVIYMTPSLPAACGSGDGRVAIRVAHPLYNSIVSAALAAKATNQTVKITYLNNCSILSSAWDFGVLEIQ